MTHTFSVMAEGNPSDDSGLEAKIEINLSRLSQLFNSLDPSPFHERDLDHDAEEYIVDWPRRSRGSVRCVW